ncbi:MAG: DUF2800 domain-containing protein [Phycisphaera sp.]|nr:DUF2800 domain-containing protein [Phycisphaera sp.]
MISGADTPRRTRPHPNDIARALTGRPYLTHSEVKTYRDCPLKWYFAYVQRAEPEVVASAMIMGTCVHAAIEHHLHAMLEADRRPTIDEMMATYRQRWDKEIGDTLVRYPRGQNADTLAETAQRMVERFLQSPFATPEGEIIGIEETFRGVKLTDDVPHLSGRVDLIEHVGDELIVTDYKTARSMWSQDTADEYASQLVLYALGTKAIAEELNATVRLRFVVLTKTKEPKIKAMPVTLTQDQIKRTTLVVRRVFESMKSGVIYPSPSPMNCTVCQHRRRCDAWHHTADQIR